MRDKHLTEAELATLAIAMDRDVRPEVAEHLGSCPFCREELRALRADLENLSRIARDTAPSSMRAFNLPVNVGRRSSLHTPWRAFPSLTWGAWGGALVAATLLLVFWLAGPSREPAPSREQAQRMFMEDVAMLHEMRALERDPLPEIVHAFIGDAGEELDEEFLGPVEPFLDLELSS